MKYQWHIEEEFLRRDYNYARVIRALGELLDAGLKCVSHAPASDYYHIMATFAIA